MNRLPAAALRILSSRAVPPVVIGLFFLTYIGIAFFTDETLITLMAFTRRSMILAALLALIPLNYGLRVFRETSRHLAIRRLMVGNAADARPDLFDETVELQAGSLPQELDEHLAAIGYRTRRSGRALSACRGVSGFPIRLLFLAGAFCLFSGILISITSRTAVRQMVVEGVQMPTPRGDGGTVERISLEESTGSILSRNLTMKVAPSPASGGKSFGIYPPSLYSGYFVYPRYLGLGLTLRFSSPDLPGGYVSTYNLNCYPPGKEDSLSISGTKYRVVLSLPEPAAGTDRYQSYMANSRIFRFKLLKGDELLISGNIASGGDFAQGGYRLEIPDVRRLVVTDFIGDYGLPFIWSAAFFLAAALCLWLPLRLFMPRREMAFICENGIVKGCSRSEGGTRGHAGAFHEALDMIAARGGATRMDSTQEG